MPRLWQASPTCHRAGTDIILNMSISPYLKKRENRIDKKFMQINSTKTKILNLPEMPLKACVTIPKYRVSIHPSHMSVSAAKCKKNGTCLYIGKKVSTTSLKNNTDGVCALSQLFVNHHLPS